MTTLNDIVELAHKYARARGKLVSRCGIIQRAINRLKFNNRRELQINTAAVATAYNDLESAINSNRHFFDKPKTIEIDSIKFGLRKDKGTMSWEDDAKLIEKIRNLYDEETVNNLIRVKETPDAKALAKLTDDQLKKLGITITQDRDEVYIVPVGSTEVEKLAIEFLKEAAAKEP